MYYIAVNGQKAVDLARKIIGNKCYLALMPNGKWLTQIEVVIDEPGNYNGKPNKWVDFSFINPEDIETVIKWLKENGFSGCFAYMANEITGKNEKQFII